MQITKHILALALFGLSLCHTAIADEWQHREVRVCAEDAGWPPYSIPPSSEQAKFTGFNADLMKNIFDARNIPYTVLIRPWKRCLLDGKSGDIDVVLDAASNEERQKDYLLTNAVYELTPSFFFSLQKQGLYPNPVSADQLSGKLICGQKGYIYSNFGIPEEKVSSISKDLKKILDLADMGRCDIGLARKEVLLTELKRNAYGDKIGYQTIDGAQSERFYWLLNRNTEFSGELKQIIDSDVANLRQNKTSDQLLKAYF